MCGSGTASVGHRDHRSAQVTSGLIETAARCPGGICAPGSQPTAAADPVSDSGEGPYSLAAGALSWQKKTSRATAPKGTKIVQVQPARAVRVVQTSGRDREPGQEQAQSGEDGTDKLHTLLQHTSQM